MTAKLILLHAVSPLHTGTGQGIDVIDLPIAREKATDLPYVPGSTVKGILRDNTDKDLADKVFGKLRPQDPADFYAGSIQFADARLLLIPIRSLCGTFAWVTSPYIFARLARDLKDAGLMGPTAAAPVVSAKDACLVVVDNAAIVANKVYLEDLALSPTTDVALKAWAEWLAPKVFPNDPSWQAFLTSHLCVVHDDVLAFLLQTATEVTARIRIDDDKKTVATGGLWYEEALPAETVLAGLAVTNLVKGSGASEDDVTGVLDGLTNKVLQVGGKATVGRGVCRFQVS